MIDHVQAVMDGLCRYYTGKDGQPRPMNTTQVAVYSSHLAKFSHEQLNHAAQKWMAQSAFFPAVSDLLKILRPTVDLQAQAHLAWTALESALRRGGIYNGATFLNGAVGETARQVFGTWQHACQYETDSPGWAIRRQTFLAIYPGIAERQWPAVTLRGLAENASPYVVAPILGLPEPAPLLEAPQEDEPISRDDARQMLARLADIERLRPKK